MGQYQDRLGNTRGTAVEILEVFELLLNKYRITIPDEDRTGDESEAAIYGMTYAAMENEITSILEEYIKE